MADVEGDRSRLAKTGIQREMDSGDSQDFEMDPIDRGNQLLSDTSDEPDATTRTDETHPRRRGRPALSKVSRTMTRKTLSNPFMALRFDRVEDYAHYVQELAQYTDDKTLPKTKYRSFYRLREGPDVAKELLQREGISQDSTIALISRIRHTTDQVTPSEARVACPEIVKLIQENSTILPEGESDDNPKFYRDLRVEIIRMRALEGKTLANISAVLGIPVSTVFSLLKKYRADPLGFCQSISPQEVPKAMFSKGARDRIEADIASGAVCLKNAGELATYLRDYASEGSLITRKNAVRIAKTELGLVKKKPKIRRESPRVVYDSALVKAVDALILHLFYCKKSMLIMDTVSFSNDKLGVTAYGPRGVRPVLPGQSSPVSYHAMVIISVHGVEALSVCKRTITTAVISDFLVSSLQELRVTSREYEDFRYLFLDNAPVHGDSIARDVLRRFGLTVVYNVPKNPVRNPIENYFAVLKRKYRCKVANNRRTDPEDLVDCVRSIAGETYRKTMAYVKETIVQKLSA